MTNNESKKLIPPYGGEFVNLLSPVEEIDAFRDRTRKLPSVRLSERSVCDLELLATGAFSPKDEEWEELRSGVPAPAADSPDVWQEHGEVT